MKKFFHFAAIALVATALTVACKSGNDEEEEGEKTPAMDSVVDSIPVEDSIPVVDTLPEATEQPAAKAKTSTKKGNKITESKNETPVDANANAKGRLGKAQAEQVGVKEATPTKNGSTPDPNKNAENRLKAKAK